MSLPTPMELMTEKYERAQRVIAERNRIIAEQDQLIKTYEFWQNCRKEFPELALKATRMGPEVYS